MTLKKNFILREIMDEYVLVPVGETAETFYGMGALNEVGARIWALLPEAEDEEALVRQLLQEYEVSEEVLRRDVAGFMQQLRTEGIID